MEIGDFVKMSLPGETPWGEVVAMGADGCSVLRVDNRTVGGDMPDDERAACFEQIFGEPAGSILPRLHDFKRGDLVVCRLNELGLWEPMEARR